MEEKNNLPEVAISSKIYVMRGLRVMLDSDLAELYSVETKQLKRAVRRNIERFPDDFMFELSKDEVNYLENSLKCQIGTSNKGGTRYAPFAFTEQGVAMLSSVLNSKDAIQVNIQIMRIFTKVKQYLTDNTEVLLELERIKSKLGEHDQHIDLIFQTLDQLINKKQEPLPPIGYRK